MVISHAMCWDPGPGSQHLQPGRPQWAAAGRGAGPDLVPEGLQGEFSKGAWGTEKTGHVHRKFWGLKSQKMRR